MGDSITVETDLFQHREVKPHFINPCCFGEDFARVEMSRLNATFTKLQGQYRTFISMYTKLHRRPPAEAGMQAYFRAPPSVHNMIVTLERRGLISRTAGEPRSIRVLVDSQLLPPLD